MFNYKDCLILAIAFIISLLSQWKLDDFYMNAFYTILGIMFSIALGLLVTFNLQGIRNRSIITKIRKNIKTVRSIYIKYFIISTIVYLAEKYFRDGKNNIWDFAYIKNYHLSFNFSLFTITILLFSISYFIINFIAMQKLNDDLYDEVNK